MEDTKDPSKAEQVASDTGSGIAPILDSRNDYGFYDDLGTYHWRDFHAFCEGSQWLQNQWTFSPE